MYGGGRIADAVTIPKDARVRIRGKPFDGGWYKVYKEDDDLLRWLREDFVELEPPNCNITQYHMSYLLNIVDEEKELLIDDTFVGDNNWVNTEGKPVPPTLAEDKRPPEQQLQLRTDPNESVFVSSDNQKLLDVDEFTLTTSVNRTNYGWNSYVAFRFLQHGDRYIEARINADCTVEFLVDGEIKQTRELDGGKNKCTSQDEDYIILSLSERQLRIEVNDSGIVRFDLPPDPLGRHISGRIWLGSYHATMAFNFVVVTSPR